MRGGRRGYSLVELTIVITVMAVILAMTVPSFQRALETAKADIAVANLHAVWAAERFYWLEYRSYTGDLAQLTALGLLDPEMTSGTTPYVYSLSVAPDGSAFTATAARVSGPRWAGSFAIDQTGAVTGQLSADGETDIKPAAL